MESLVSSKPCVSFEFEVEKIIGISNNGTYQVQWAPAWVSKFHLVGCEHLIQQFLQQQQDDKVEKHAEQVCVLPPPCETEQLSTGIDSSGRKKIIETSDTDELSSVKRKLPCVQSLVHDLQSDFLDSVGNIGDETRSASDQSDRQLQLNSVNLNIKREYGVVSTERCVSSAIPFLTTQITGSSATKQQSSNGRIGDPSESVARYQGMPEKSLVDPEANSMSSRIKSDIGQYTCHRCKLTFLEKIDLDKHSLLQCKYGEVNLQFDKLDQTTLRQQILSRADDSIHTCSICHSVFMSSSCLKRHSRTHTGERPHSCDECGKSFLHKSHLTEHLRTHTGDKPYSCSVCGKTFTTSGHRSRHSRRVHQVQNRNTDHECENDLSQT